MLPVNEQGKPPEREELLGRLWDALQESGTLGSVEIEPEDVQVITGLHEADDVPPPSQEVIQSMWVNVAVAVVQPHPQANGLQQRPVETHSISTAQVKEGTRAIPTDRIIGRARNLVRTLAIAGAAGFLAGFLALGGGGRLIMRVAAMLSEDELQGTLTENEAVVGTITFGGTLELMVTGGIVGISLGIGFAMIQSLLPAAGMRRILASAAMYFAVCGFVTLEAGDNADYERFGIVGLNVCLFTLLPFVFGILISPTYDRMQRWVPVDLPRFARSPKTVLVSLALLAAMPLVLMGSMLLLVLAPLQLFLLAPVLAGGGQWLISRGNFDRSTLPLWSRRLALTIPGVAGLILTMVAIGRIV